MKATSTAVLLSLFGLASVCLTIRAADKPKPAPPGQKRETVAKPLSEREKRSRDERLRKELESPYKKWLDEDVGYILTPEERQSFKRLSTDDERESFIESFWLRRDPTPDTMENEYQGRALPADRLRQRPLRVGYPRLEDRPR